MRPPRITAPLDDGPHIVGPASPGPGAPETALPVSITAAWGMFATALGQSLPHGINRANAASRRLMQAVR